MSNTFKIWVEQDDVTKEWLVIEGRKYPEVTGRFATSFEANERAQELVALDRCLAEG